MQLDGARYLVLAAADCLDRLGNKAARCVCCVGGGGGPWSHITWSRITPGHTLPHITPCHTSRLLTRHTWSHLATHHTVPHIAPGRTSHLVTPCHTSCLTTHHTWAHLTPHCWLACCRGQIAEAKVAAPSVALHVIDAAIQAHGGAGVCQDTVSRSFTGGERTSISADLGPAVDARAHAQTPNPCPWPPGLGPAVDACAHAKTPNPCPWPPGLGPAVDARAHAAHRRRPRRGPPHLHSRHGAGAPGQAVARAQGCSWRAWPSCSGGP